MGVSIHVEKEENIWERKGLREMVCGRGRDNGKGEARELAGQFKWETLGVVFAIISGIQFYKKKKKITNSCFTYTTLPSDSSDDTFLRMTTDFVFLC